MKLTFEIESLADAHQLRLALRELLGVPEDVLVIPQRNVDELTRGQVRKRLHETLNAGTHTSSKHPGSNGDVDWQARAEAAVNTQTTVQSPLTEPDSITEVSGLTPGKPELAYTKEQMKAAGQIDPTILDLLKIKGRKSDDRVLELNRLTAAALQDAPNEPEPLLGEALAGATAEDLQQEMVDTSEEVEVETEAAETGEQPDQASTPAKTSVVDLLNAAQDAPDADKLRADLNSYMESLGLHEGIAWYRALTDKVGPIENLEPAYMVELLANPGMVFTR